MLMLVLVLMQILRHRQVPAGQPAGRPARGAQRPTRPPAAPCPPPTHLPRPARCRPAPAVVGRLRALQAHHPRLPAALPHPDHGPLHRALQLPQRQRRQLLLRGCAAGVRVGGVLSGVPRAQRRGSSGALRRRGCWARQGQQPGRGPPACWPARAQRAAHHRHRRRRRGPTTRSCAPTPAHPHPRAGARLFFRSLEAAVFLFSRVARIPEGSLVLPAICTEERIILGAELEDGTVLKGALLAGGLRRGPVACCIGQRPAASASGLLHGPAVCCIGQRPAAWASGLLHRPAACCMGQRPAARASGLLHGRPGPAAPGACAPGLARPGCRP
jgi:hypothetical protein